MIEISRKPIEHIPFTVFRRHNDLLCVGEDTNMSIVVLNKSTTYVALSDSYVVSTQNRLGVKDFADMIKMMHKIRRARINLQPVGRLILRSGKKRRQRVVVNAHQF
jgi:hypothetical protein